jgi:pimeloyl-ACP methyl ester carboxylesterase
MPPPEAVVLVHGIWMTGLDLVVLRHRLRKAGFDAGIHTYSSLARTPVENARGLRAHVESLDAEVVHLVGHSLGGVTILHLFEHGPLPRPGRVVFLGSPVRGSGVARVLASRRPTRFFLGRSVVRGLLGDVPAWGGERELGVVAGSWPVGVGSVLGGLRGPHDGTVSVRETRVPLATDRVVLPVTHSGLVASRDVADHVIRFLRTGLFAPAGVEAAS